MKCLHRAIDVNKIISVSVVQYLADSSLHLYLSHLFLGFFFQLQGGGCKTHLAWDRIEIAAVDFRLQA